jgi:hypothetical protein
LDYDSLARKEALIRIYEKKFEKLPEETKKLFERFDFKLDTDLNSLKNNLIVVMRKELLKKKFLWNFEEIDEFEEEHDEIERRFLNIKTEEDLKTTIKRLKDILVSLKKWGDAKEIEKELTSIWNEVFKNPTPEQLKFIDNILSKLKGVLTKLKSIPKEERRKLIAAELKNKY